MIYQGSSTVHDALRVRRQRIQAMPLWIEKTRGTNSGDWLGGLVVVAVFAGMVFA